MDTIFTDDVLDAIDRLIARPGIAGNERHTGKALFTSASHPDVDLLNDELREHGWETYAHLLPFRPRRPYEKSLWVRRADGRTIPEIHALAIIKFGVTLDTDPFWSDGDCTNNVSSNISIVQQHDPQLRRSKYGVRSTTPEYRKKYYENPENKARQREAAKVHAAKKRKQIKAAKEALGDDLPDTLPQLKPDGRRGEEDDRLSTSAEVSDVTSLLDQLVEEQTK